jgi:hypothetical protein
MIDDRSIADIGTSRRVYCYSVAASACLLRRTLRIRAASRRTVDAALLSERRTTITYGDNDPRMRRTSDNTGFIIGAVIAALMILLAGYWASRSNSNTASSGGTAPTSQTTGSGSASKTTTGSGSPTR